MGVPISERLANAKYNRQTKKAKRKALRSSKKSGPGKRKEGKYVSTQSTVSDVGQVYKPNEGIIEHNITNAPSTETSKHTLHKYLTDATGKEFHIGDEVTTNITKHEGSTEKGDKDGDTFVDKERGELYDNNKKFFGNRINEVYKINDLTPNEKGGKELNKMRQSTISHGAQTYHKNMAAGGEVGSITRLDSPKKMHQEKTNKRGQSKSKSYVSKKYLGGATTFDTEGNVLDHGANKSSDHGKDKKQWKAEGYKVISDKRMERKHKRMGNFKQNKTVMSGNRAAGGTDRKNMVETDKSANENTIVKIANRLWEGKEKNTDIYRKTRKQRKSSKKK